MPTIHFVLVGLHRCFGFVRNLADASVATLKRLIIAIRSFLLWRYLYPQSAGADSPEGHADHSLRSQMVYKFGSMNRAVIRLKY